MAPVDFKKKFSFRHSNSKYNREKTLKHRQLKFQLSELKIFLRNMIDQEKVDIVQSILATTTNSSSQYIEFTRFRSKQLPHQVTSDLRLINRSISNVIETTDHQTASRISSTSLLKRKASVDDLNNNNNNNNVTINTNKCHHMSSKRIKVEKSKINWKTLHIDAGIGIDNVLHYASRRGKTCFIDMLLDMGLFGIDEANFSEERDTALGIACDFGWLDTAKLLIARGADLNYENKRGKTPLTLATELVYPYDMQMCKILVESGAQINHVIKNNSNNESTALLSACSYDNNELIKYLIEKGADYNPQQMTTKYCASTPLMRVVINGNYAMAEYLLNVGAHVDAVNKRNETALYMACYKGYLELVKLLIKYGANVNSFDCDGDTPLAIACYEKKSDVIKYLLENGANTKTYGIRGDTPLHIAVVTCDKSICEELILRGANVDDVNDENESVIYVACLHNRHQALELLLDHAKQLDIFSMSDEKPAFRYLVENLTPVKLKMALSLLKAGCDVSMSIFETAYNDLYVEFLPNGQTRLPVKKLATLIQMILKCGYRVNRKDVDSFKESWLKCHLVENNEIDVCDKLEEMLNVSLTRPKTLAELCRVKIRENLRKPLKYSITVLDMPKDLKAYLRFETI